MSHFAVAVFTDGNKTVEELLAPFHEFECTGEDDQYVQDVDITEKVNEKMQEGDSLSDVLDWFGLSERTVSDESEIDRSETHKYGYAVVRDGLLIKAIDRTNPDKKWDWWIVGGRWSNMLALTNGEQVDSAKASDIDFEVMRERERKRRERIWQEYHTKHSGDNQNASCRSHVYGIPKEVTSLEQFLELPIYPLVTYAAITPDGHWHAAGEMGWWGFSSETEDEKAEFQKLYHEKLILPAIENGWTITMVDCHI